MMSTQDEVRDDGATSRLQELFASNVVTSSSGAKCTHPSFPEEMLLGPTLVISIHTPCILGCLLNNVNSLAAAPTRCPVYGVDQVINE